jgi:hypothetical protein
MLFPNVAWFSIARISLGASTRHTMNRIVPLTNEAMSLTEKPGGTIDDGFLQVVRDTGENYGTLNLSITEGR